MVTYRDWFANAIVARLNGHLDPNVFEACACDLLRDAYPSLVPLPGGRDAGMDGAIATAGPPIPLVATTRGSVIANLTESLDSYLADNGLSREVVVATSQELTPRRVRNLEKRAALKGFTLHPVYQQQAWVDRLYYNPRWCRELLGLTANPPALASIPSGRRPLVEVTLIGQQEALNWIQTTSGDRILAGPPGSGKTYLIYQLIQRDLGLFLESDDETRVLEDLLRLQPHAVVVDDAHVRLPRLAMLRDLRRRNPALSFDIVATTWGGQDLRDVIRELPDAAPPYALPPMPRIQLVEIVKQVGIGGPPVLVAELVSQAANRPGLAVTLTHLCLRGHWQEVLSGSALRGDLVGPLRQRLGHEAADVLAILALGGTAGMPLDCASHYLDLSRGRVREILAGLSPAGVIAPTGEAGFAVRPSALRFALVSEYFFEREGSFDVEELLPEAPSTEQVLETLIGAASRGAQPPSSLIERLLLNCQRKRPWIAYAALGPSETRWALEHWPRSLAEIAQGLLAGGARHAIGPLLSAVGDHGSGWFAEPPLTTLRHWIEDLEVVETSVGESSRRRRVTVEAAIEWLKAGGAEVPGVGALLLPLTPRLESSRLDPGRGTTVSYCTGVIPPSLFAEIQNLWPEILAALRDVVTVPWEPLHTLLREWAFPDPPGACLPNAKHEKMRAFGERMLRDLATTFGQDIGLGKRLKDFADTLGMFVDVSQDPLLELLSPRQSLRGDWRLEESQHEQRISDAAEQFARMRPTDYVAALSRVHSIAERVAIRLNWWTGLLCRRLLARTPHAPADYFPACLAADPPLPELMSAVIDCLVDRKDDTVADYAVRCLALPMYERVGVGALLRHEDLPAALVMTVLQIASRHHELVELVCQRRQVPVPMLLALLQHTDLKVALSAAEGEWRSSGKSSARESVQAAWREAILRSPVGDDSVSTLEDGQKWFVGEALSGDPVLAYDWLGNQLRASRGWWHRLSFGHDVAAMAIGALSTDQRLDILDKVPPQFDWGDLVSLLVGKDLAMYGRLLDAPDKRVLHLAPLRRGPHPAWSDKAVLALRAGIAPAKIAHEALMGGGYSIAGSRAAHWRKRIEELESAVADHAELVSVVEAAREILAPEILRGEAEELSIDLYGISGED